MPRPKKDGVNINYYIRRDIKEKLDAYCEEKGQTATLAIERILDDYLSEYFGSQPKEERKKYEKDTFLRRENQQ